MRVLRVCSVYEPPATSIAGDGALLDPIGGMQTHTAALSRALVERGVEQHIVTAFRSGAPRLERPVAGLVVHRVGFPIRRLRQLYSAPALPLVVRLARRADVVHVHQGEDLAALPLGFAAARTARLPVVVTIHTSLAHTLRVVDARTAVLRRVGGPLEAVAVRRADAVITLTCRLKDLLAASGIEPERLAVIPSGVEPALFAEDSDDPFPSIPRPRVLFLGRLAAQKDVGTLLRAATMLDVHVLIVGDGPQRRMLEEQARRLGLERRITFAGFLDRPRVPAALRHSDVVVLPSAYEELGSVVLEAMWAGVPLVASRTGGLQDVVEDGRTGLLVPSGDAAGFARAISEILADGTLAERLRAGARERAPEYDWGALSARVLGVYERVLG